MYRKFSRSFHTGIGFCQGYPLSPFSFNFVIDTFMKRAPENFQDSGVQNMAGENLVDLDYADELVLLYGKK